MIPCIVPTWDHTPRSGMKGSMFLNESPEFFRLHVEDALKTVLESEGGTKHDFKLDFATEREAEQFASDMDWRYAVSYTHLDVYKRQMPTCPAVCSTILWEWPFMQSCTT